LVCVLIGFAGGISAGIFIEKNQSQSRYVSRDGTEQFHLIEQAWNIVRSNYVDRSAFQGSTLAYGSISGMVDALGDTGHSTFLTPQEVKLTKEEEQGHYQGIGAEVQDKNGKVVIFATFEGSPARQAGILPGDVIQEVNGQVVNDVTSAISLIAGPAGTSVSLTIQSPDGTTREITLVRAVINIVNITWTQLPNTTVAQLHIASFSEGTAEDLDKALADIKIQGITGLILDLRDNPGGLLDQAIEVTSRFINSGNVLQEKDVNGQITNIPVKHVSQVNSLPMVVLVNQGTASAAEIVSGALKDAGRAQLVGDTTFGTGTVLVPFPLSDGSEVVLAVQEWLTPAGKTIWHTGLIPDVTVPLATGVTPLIPVNKSGLSAAQLQDSSDQQLLQGLKMLTEGK
jgi:carboxyl-terminal processing protease